MKKVGIVTTFYEATSGFSVIGVCENQIRMLLDHGYGPVVLVREDFQIPDAPSVWRPEQVDLRRVIPALDLTEGVADNFLIRQRKVEAALRDNLADCDVCITHDVMLGTRYKEHNWAVREYAKERPDLLWLHWFHSCPAWTGQPVEWPESCRNTPPPGYVVYPNASDKAMVVRAYGMGGQEWRVRVCRAAHSIDPLLVWPYDRLTRDLAEASDLLGGDVVAVYPARLDVGKQPEKIIRLMAGVAQAGHEPRLLVIDWQSSGERFQTYKDELLVLARGLGLGGKVNFTSRLDDRCDQGVPRRVVQELMDLSNVYIHPSRVETYSLTVHEAMLRGCLCVLNHDLPVMRELFGEAAIYFDFGSDRVSRVYKPSEQAFWNDEALRLIAELRQNRAVMAKTDARTMLTPQAMFRDFEPLLYLQPVGGGP